VDALEGQLRALRSAGTPAKLFYTIPNFHNPAGVDLALDRRKRVVELAEEFNFVILEDDAYGELRFTGTAMPSLYSLAPKGRVIRSATLSKILAAGLRIGYVTAPKEVLARLNSLKLDGGASPFTNRVAARWLEASHDRHVRQLIDIYRGKRDALIRGLVANVHVKERAYPTTGAPGVHMRVLLGTGAVPWPEVIAALQADGYAGVYSIETHFGSRGAYGRPKLKAASTWYMYALRELLEDANVTSGVG
jgi:DNA-binding transcriptional MocR family regulator